MLIEQQVELVERRPPHEPMVLLVQGVEDLRVGEKLVQPLAGIEAGVVRQSEWKQPHGPNSWISCAVLMIQGLTAEFGAVRNGRLQSLSHGNLLDSWRQLNHG